MTHMETTTVKNEVPEIQMAQTLGAQAVHVARTNHHGVASACNGRQMTMAARWVGGADEVTCKRCRKLVTL